VTPFESGLILNLLVSGRVLGQISDFLVFCNGFVVKLFELVSPVVGQVPFRSRFDFSHFDYRSNGKSNHEPIGKARQKEF
jgi:hypothetical protein